MRGFQRFEVCEVIIVNVEVRERTIHEKLDRTESVDFSSRPVPNPIRSDPVAYSMAAYRVLTIAC